MRKILIITPDEEIKSIEYKDWKSIQEAVEGHFEIFYRTPMELPSGNIDTTFYCNEEFLIINDEKFDKINAAASLLYGGEIRGNVAVTVDLDTPDGIESVGFEYMEEDVGGEIEEAICEHWWVKDAIMRFINDNRDVINELHMRYDHQKSEPHVEIVNSEEDLMR